MPPIAPQGIHDPKDNWFSPKNEGFPYDEVYKPLTGNNVTRLVRVLAGDVDTPIQCHLDCQVTLTVPRDPAQTPYSALSYCAGNVADCGIIELDGYPFSVFRSLYLALLQLRSTSHDTYFWLDQICINQTNFEERDSQVLMMKEVYSHAETTYVWLGMPNDKTEAAFDLIHSFLEEHRTNLRECIMTFTDYLDDYMQSSRRTDGLFSIELADYIESDRKFRRRARVHGTESGFEVKFGLPESMEAKIQWACKWAANSINDSSITEAWRGIEDLVNRPWFTRCWILQEAAVTPNLIICCGGLSVAWEDLALLLILLWARPSADRDDEYWKKLKAHTGHWYGFSDVHKFRQEGEYESLVELISHSWYNQTSDARDKVYSLLGLLNEDGRESCRIKPNYTQANTAQSVYFTTAKACILTKDREYYLALTIGYPKPAGTPSWVFKPSQQQRGMSLGGETKAGTDLQAMPRFVEDDSVLIIQCVHLAEITKISRVVCDVHGNLQIEEAEYEGVGRVVADEEETLRDTCLDALRRNIVDNGYAKGEERYYHYFELRGRRVGFIRSAGPSVAPRPGDTVVILAGFALPYIVRESVLRPGYVRLVHPCWVTGVMNGEVVDLIDSGEAVLTDLYFD